MWKKEAGLGGSHQSLCNTITILLHCFLFFFQNEIKILSSMHSFCWKRKIVFKKDTMKGLLSTSVTLYPLAPPWLINNFSCVLPVFLYADINKYKYILIFPFSYKKVCILYICIYIQKIFSASYFSLNNIYLEIFPYQYMDVVSIPSYNHTVFFVYKYIVWPGPDCGYLSWFWFLFFQTMLW